MTLAAAENGDKSGEPWSVFFEGAYPKMPSSEQRTSWPDQIVVRSRERPRDAVQLINQSADTAISEKLEKITEGVFAKVMKDFSRVRVSLLAQEVEDECPNLENIIRSLSRIDFDKSSFKATCEVVRDHIRSLGSEFGVILYGRTLNLSRTDDVIELWRFLFDIGVVNARVSDKREKDGFRHVDPRMDPTLVSATRWNDMQKVVWEIGPAYRDFLIDVQQQTNASIGLPPLGRKNVKRRRPKRG